MTFRQLHKHHSHRRRTWLTTIAATASVCVAVLLLVSAYGGCFNPSTHSALWSVATLAFPIVLTLALALLLLWLVLRQWLCAAVMALAVALSWPTVAVTSPVNVKSASPSSAASDSTGNRFKMLTFNVMNFGRYDGTQSTRNPSMDFILKQNADLVVLQEAALSDTDFVNLPSIRMMRPQIEKAYPYHSNGYHDLVIMSRYPYKVVEDTVLRNVVIRRDQYGPLYHFFAKIFDVQMPHGRQLRLITVHMQSIGLTPDDKQLYMRLTTLDESTVASRREIKAVKHSLLAKLARAFRLRAAEARSLRSIIDASPQNVIVAGDFNDTPASYCYRTVRGTDMADAWADCAFGPTYTFNAYRLYFRIDHILYRGALKAVGVERWREGDSDHYPLVATFEWTKD